MYVLDSIFTLRRKFISMITKNFQIVSDDIIRIYKTLVEYCHSEATKVQICRSSLGGPENLQ
jgi:hypothetical protein